MSMGGFSGRRPAPATVALLTALVVTIAGCTSGAGPTPVRERGSRGTATRAPTAGAATSTPARPRQSPPPRQSRHPFPAAGVKWLKAYCPAAKQFVGIVTMYQGIQGDMASLNFGDIQPRVTKMLASVLTLETLVKKIPIGDPAPRRRRA